MIRGFAACLVVMVAFWGGLVTIYDDAGRAHVLQVNETGGVGRAWQVHDMTTGRSWTIESDGLSSSYPERSSRPLEPINEDKSLPWNAPDSLYQRVFGKD